uniref:NADH-ubiquinone oxidoreductase chain 4L n=1 Tax=Bipes canaliculatus TaxID=273521 RepID=Q66SG7_BIPCA|nr:NADH dehydrogenase subunit 4L [Bipes canaliculatus]AAT08614.1 NADH dehydrogenase subunit 4L [Bipes canaliculatus]
MAAHLTLLSTAFALSITGMALHRLHLISVLLCIESIMLTLFIALALTAINTTNPLATTAPLMLLTLSACEASTGLALLVATTRTHSTDHVNSMNILQC